ncbi:hypothetical protein ACET63_13855 [Aeromonas sanarellii]
MSGQQRRPTPRRQSLPPEGGDQAGRRRKQGVVIRRQGALGMQRQRPQAPWQDVLAVIAARRG